MQVTCLYISWRGGWTAVAAYRCRRDLHLRQSTMTSVVLPMLCRRECLVDTRYNVSYSDVEADTLQIDDINSDIETDVMMSLSSDCSDDFMDLKCLSKPIVASATAPPLLGHQQGRLSPLRVKTLEQDPPPLPLALPTPSFPLSSLSSLPCPPSLPFF